MLDTALSALFSTAERSSAEVNMWPTEDPTEMLRWRIQCAAPADTAVTVLVVGDRVAVVIPPGETLVFTAEEAEGLARLVDRAGGFATSS